MFNCIRLPPVWWVLLTNNIIHPSTVLLIIMVRRGGHIKGSKVIFDSFHRSWSPGETKRRVHDRTRVFREYIPRALTSRMGLGLPMLNMHSLMSALVWASQC
jgi:hypothetical protein